MNPIFETSFWQRRLQDAQHSTRLTNAIGLGFDFGLIDRLHREIVGKEIKTGVDKVLDVGCGYGRTSVWFADQVYTGIDFVPEFIDLAQKMYPNKKFILMDIREPLNFGPKVFDWGIFISMKEMIKRDAGEEEWNKIQSSLKRHCKKLLILEYGNNREEEIRKYEII